MASDENLLDDSLGEVTPPTQTKKASFYNDFLEGTCGTVTKAGKSRKADFAMKIVSFVEAGENTGYFCDVKRQMDSVERRCYIKSNSLRFVWKFIEQINYSFGSGGMACSFNEKELSEFIPFLRDQGPKPLPQLKAAQFVGRQAKANDQANDVWVFNSDVQINYNGASIEPQKSGYVWLNELHMSDAKVLSSDILPTISLPLTSTPLDKIIRLLQCFKHNAMSGLLTIAGFLMAFHYEYVVAMWSGCPVVAAIGPAETGKSTAIEIGLAMTGLDESSKYVSGSTAFFLDRSCNSTLPFGIDDPPDPKNTKSTLRPADIIMSLFNGAKTANMRVLIKPKSTPIFASNFELPSDKRVCSRAVVIRYSGPSVGPMDEEGDELFQHLETALNSKELSSCAGWIVSLGKALKDEGKSFVTKLRAQLREKFSSRECTNWCILLFFLHKLLEELKDCQDRAGQDDDSNEIEVTSAEPIFLHLFPCNIEKVMDMAIAFILSKTEHPLKPGLQLEEKIIDCLQTIASYAKTLPLSQVLEFMRVGTTFNDEEAVAIYLPLLTSVVSKEDKKSLMKLKLCDMGGIDTRSLLEPGKNENSITKENSRRRKCVLVYLSKLHNDLVEAIREATTSTRKAISTSNSPSTSPPSTSTLTTPSTSPPSTSILKQMAKGNAGKENEATCTDSEEEEASDEEEATKEEKEEAMEEEKADEEEDLELEGEKVKGGGKRERLAMKVKSKKETTPKPRTTAESNTDAALPQPKRIKTSLKDKLTPLYTPVETFRKTKKPNRFAY